jgi:hypothetical protein
MGLALLSLAKVSLSSRTNRARDDITGHEERACRCGSDTTRVMVPQVASNLRAGVEVIPRV